MRWSELTGKELIDLQNGQRLGELGRADLLIDPQTGEIGSLLFPVSHSWFQRRQDMLTISWNRIRKIGPDMVIVDSVGERNGWYHSDRGR
ncbi:YlmC/YmxH family sporulation protein [Polycladomyces subterraneus]|uniref:YlmC/YmxH family sporulation protein n=1 Tax=Polycladomyces subterraneus TaxID=1016997 RepID=A0ABT8INR5_9BACL|nr:YlmC/YmxH family sporulation protein [Polycladomyces subterraneus]MDN4594443.1 YlmC/YmxH family sporulation protein [Polycladomyces subterraneus]